MMITHLTTDAEVDKVPIVKALFADIRETRGSDSINNIWRALAADPPGFKRIWENVKSLMAMLGALEPKTHEMICIAVSVANRCSYWVHSHTTAAKAKVMSDAEHAESIQNSK